MMKAILLTIGFYVVFVVTMTGLIFNWATKGEFWEALKKDIKDIWNSF